MAQILSRSAGVFPCRFLGEAGRTGDKPLAVEVAKMDRNNERCVGNQRKIFGFSWVIMGTFFLVAP